MCYTLDVFYSCKGRCRGRNGKKNSVVFNGQRVDLNRYQVCSRAHTRRGPQAHPWGHYEFRYPMRCWTCQAQWIEEMKPSIWETTQVEKRLRNLYGHLETWGQINERVGRVLDILRRLIRECIDNAETYERDLDAELQQVLSDLHQGRSSAVDGQVRLDMADRSVDYAKFEMGRRYVLRNSTG